MDKQEFRFWIEPLRFSLNDFESLFLRVDSFSPNRISLTQQKKLDAFKKTFVNRINKLTKDLKENNKLVDLI